MSSARQKLSTWKRPKPRIYDCNRRDLENLYKPSYEEYKTTKADREARTRDWDERGGLEGISRRFEQRRANSLAGPDEDSSYSRSQHTTTESSYRQTQNAAGGGGDHDSGRSFVRSTTSNSRQVNFDDSSADDNYEARMEKIKQLRRDMGLPAEAGASVASSSTVESRYSARNETNDRSSPSEARTSRFLKTESSSRSTNAGRRSPMHGDHESKSSYSSKYESSRQNGVDDLGKKSSYSSKYESSTQNGIEDSSRGRFSSRSGADDDSSMKYSFKSSRSKASDGDDLEAFESSINSRLKDRKRVEKPTLDGIEIDDDFLLKDISKKIPSSSDILERIKNMDID